MAWVTRDVINFGYNFVFDAIGSGNLAAEGGLELGHVRSLAGPTVTIDGDTISWDAVTGADHYRVFAFAPGESIITPYVPDDRSIDIFTPTNNTYLAMEHAVAYATIPATQLTFNLQTGFNPVLPDGDYIIRVQSISNNTEGDTGPLETLPRFNSLLSPGLPHTLGDLPPAQQLSTPQNLRFEYVNAGFRIDGQNGGIAPFVNNASRALVWDPVPNATGYIVYAFEVATETNPAEAYRYQEIGLYGRDRLHEDWIDQADSGRPNLPNFVIGHDSVVQSRTQFVVQEIPPVEIPGGVNHVPICPDTGYLSWGAMVASARQDFDVPLPFREFHFRVVAIHSDDDRILDSDMSAAVAAYPGARSAAPSQAARLIEEARERGAAYPYFIFIQSGTVGVNDGGVANRLYIPFSNSPTPVPDYFSLYPIDGPETGRNRDGLSNWPWVDRVIMEIRNHPAYNGPDTLIFHG